MLNIVVPTCGFDVTALGILWWENYFEQHMSICAIMPNPSGNYQGYDGDQM